jgi:hypothetical protein
VDTFLPHLRLLFSIWTPRQREKKKISFQQFMESQTGGEGGGGEGEQGPGALSAAKGDAEEKRDESALTVTEPASKISASDFHGLDGYIRYLSLTPTTAPSPSPAGSQAYSLFQELSMLLVGRVGRVSAARFAAADTVRLCGSLHQVRAAKAVAVAVAVTVRVLYLPFSSRESGLDCVLSCPILAFSCLEACRTATQKHTLAHTFTHAFRQACSN